MADNYFKDDILADALSESQRARNAGREEQRRKKEREIEKRRVASENRKKRLKVVPFVVLAFVVLVVMVGQSAVQIRELSKEKADAQNRLNELEITIEKLNDELDRVTSDEYIEQQARARLRMIYPGERLYIMLEENK